MKNIDVLLTRGFLLQNPRIGFVGHFEKLEYAFENPAEDSINSSEENCETTVRLNKLQFYIFLLIMNKNEN